MDENNTTEEIPDGTYSTRGGNGSFGIAGRSRKVKKNKRLTPHQWGELIGLLKTGHYTQTELAEQYGVSVTAIAKKRKALGGVKIGENATTNTALAQAEKTAEVLNNAIGFSIEEAGRLITEAKRKTFRRNEAIGKVIESKMAIAVRDNNLASIKDDIKVLMDIQTAFERELRLTGMCLGFKDGEFDTASDVPVLTIEKMTEEEIYEAQHRLEEDDSMLDGSDDADMLDDDEIDDMRDDA